MLKWLHTDILGRRITILFLINIYKNDSYSNSQSLTVSKSSIIKNMVTLSLNILRKHKKTNNNGLILY